MANMWKRGDVKPHHVCRATSAGTASLIFVQAQWEPPHLGNGGRYQVECVNNHRSNVAAVGLR